MTAREAYEAIKSRQIWRRNEAWKAGWNLPEYHDSRVVMRNRKTGEVVTGRRKARKDGEWCKRIAWQA